jgi:two-component system sensor histidine kinase KdpD
MQMGNFTLNRHWQTLEEVIGVSMGDCAAALARHKVIIDLPIDLPLLELDSVLMERVFNNLLENGAKHTPPGTVLHLAARQTEKFVTITLSDNGPGLPTGMEEKIFDKFTRGKAESSSAGFGLGLAIVRAIVEAHAGQVTADTLPEGGACFTIRLPAGEPPAIPEESE